MTRDGADVHRVHVSGVQGACCAPTRRSFLTTAALVTGAALLPGSLFAQTKYRRIDTHFHFYPPELGDALGGGQASRWTPQVALDVMDKNEIESAVLSLSSIPPDWFRKDVQAIRKTVRIANDYAAQLVRDKPKRFGQWGFLSMADVEGSLQEIGYIFDTLKADGIGIATSYGDKWPGDATFAPIFEELNRRKAVVYFHPNAPFCCAGTLVTNVSQSWLEYPFDTTRAVSSLLFGGTFAKYRDIRFLFSHGGGTIPMLAGRLSSSSTKSFKDLAKVAPEGVEAEFRRLHYDTANATTAPTIAALTKLVPVSQIVYGSDYPYYTEEENVRGLETVGLTRDQLTAIYRDNALKLVPRLKG